jgi:long-chain acyl-CoA synthetase
VSSKPGIEMEEVQRHYSHGSTIKEIAILPDPRDGRWVAVVVPDLDHFRQTGETDLRGEVAWEMEYLSQQLPFSQRVGNFILTNQELPKSQPGKIKADEAELLYRRLTQKRPRTPRSALKEGPLSALGQEVVRLLKSKTGAAINWGDYLDRDLGFDSFALVELLLALEKTFDLQIEDGEFVGILTVGELIRFIEGRQPQEFKKAAEAALTWENILQAPAPIDILDPIIAAQSFKGRFLNLGAALWLKVLFRLAFDLKIYGRQRLGPGSYILCPNHGSFLDGFLLFAAVPQALRSRLHFLGYNNYFDGPVVKDIAKYMHVVSVNSARHLIPAMQVSAYILRHRGALGIFPEGARTLTGELRPFKKGVAVLAQEVGVPLVPVYIHGSYRAWGPNARFPRPTPIQISFGRAFSPDLLAKTGRALKPGSQTYEAIILGLRQEVLNLRDELLSMI